MEIGGVEGIPKYEPAIFWLQEKFGIEAVEMSPYMVVQPVYIPIRERGSVGGL